MPRAKGIVAAALFLLSFSLSLDSAFRPAAARPAPLAVIDLDGKPTDPFKLAAGKLVVLLFVRTDCPISNRYAPTIQDLSARYAKSAVFFLIYPIRTESPETIRKHLQDYAYKLPALRDPDETLVHAAQARITPESALFSSTGQLLYHGRIDDWYSEFGRSRPAPTTHELSSAIEAAIAGKPPANPNVPGVGCFLPESR